MRVGRGCSAVPVGVTYPEPKPEFWDKVPQGSRRCREQEPASEPSRCKEGPGWNPMHEAEAPRAATQGTRSPCQRDRTLSLVLSGQTYPEELRQEWALLARGTVQTVQPTALTAEWRRGRGPARGDAYGESPGGITLLRGLELDRN